MHPHGDAPTSSVQIIPGQGALSAFVKPTGGIQGQGVSGDDLPFKKVFAQRVHRKGLG